MSDGFTRKYDPADVVFTFGVMAASGLAKGSFIEVDRYEDAAKMDIGSDGEATVIVSNNQSGSFKLTLQQSSPMHDYLNTVYQAFKNKDFKNGVQSSLMTDKNGNSLARAKQSWVKKPCKMVFSDGAENWEWTIDTGYLDTQPGSQSVLGS